MTPDMKLRLVMAHQQMGERVLVTGDGFNDGPALRAANVGVAMGESFSCSPPCQRLLNWNSLCCR
jgi:P-type E1-E2 ATPase